MGVWAPYFQGFSAASVVSAALFPLGVLASNGLSLRQTCFQLCQLFHSRALFFFSVVFNSQSKKVTALPGLFIPLTLLWLFTSPVSLLAFGWTWVRHIGSCIETEVTRLFLQMKTSRGLLCLVKTPDHHEPLQGTCLQLLSM